MKNRLWVKGVKLLRLFQHTLFSMRGKEIGNYPGPPEDFEVIGYFDKKRRVHVSAENREYFSDSVLYKGGEYTRLLPGQIMLARYEDKILVQKIFTGAYKYLKFYNELICLHRLSYVKGVPDILFVDYRSCSIYMEYLYGFTVSWKRRNSALGLHLGNIDEFEENFLNLLKKIHEQKIIIYDLKGSNMMKSDSKSYFLDFADSVYYSYSVPGFTDAMIQSEVLKVRSELEKYISNQPR